MQDAVSAFVIWFISRLLECMDSQSAGVIWTKSLDAVAQSINNQAFHTWFRPLTPLQFSTSGERGELVLEAPSAFHGEWIVERYSQLLTEAVTRGAGIPTRVAFTARRSGQIVAEEPEPVHAPERSLRVERPRAGMARDEAVATGLNPRYAFEHFVEGDCNRLARSAAEAIAQRPGATSFNPFIVFGNVGYGKTHLAQAIGNAVVDGNRSMRVRYLSSEQFTGEFIGAVKQNAVAVFTQCYRSVDVLIVDDIQFLGGKEKTQEEFFHIFNDLHQRGKQIVLCSDRAPKDIAGMQERLLSRFLWGLSAELQAPDFTTRIAILRNQLERNGVRLTEEASNFVAARINNNVRELEGASVRLQAFARLQHGRMELAQVQSALRDMLGDPERSVGIGDIQETTARYYGLTTAHLLGRSRKKEVTQARQVAMYLCKERVPDTLAVIGTHFGGRDHSTVVHACSAVEQRRATDPALESDLASIRQELGRRR